MSPYIDVSHTDHGSRSTQPPQGPTTSTSKPWVRSQSGLIAGVCSGIARRFGVEAWTVRLLWLVAVLAFGTGLLLYAVLAFCLPREDRLLQAQDKRVLGLCSRLSRASGIDVGLLRAAAVLLAFASFGATVIGYVVAHFVVREDRLLPPAGWQTNAR